jgi:hypothetical protein
VRAVWISGVSDPVLSGGSTDDLLPEPATSLSSDG